MRRYGSFEIRRKSAAIVRRDVPRKNSPTFDDSFGACSQRRENRAHNVVPVSRPAAKTGRPSSRGERSTERSGAAFPLTSGTTRILFRRWLIGAGLSVRFPLILRVTFIRRISKRSKQSDSDVPFLPIQIHTRSANAKWLNEMRDT